MISFKNKLILTLPIYFSANVVPFSFAENKDSQESHEFVWSGTKKRDKKVIYSLRGHISIHVVYEPYSATTVTGVTETKLANQIAGQEQ